MSDPGCNVGDRVIWDSRGINGGGEYPCVVTALAAMATGVSVQVRVRKRHAPRFWVPLYSVRLDRAGQ